METLGHEHQNPVPEWVAGMVGSLSATLMALVIVINAVAAKPKDSGERDHYRTGMLLSFFGGQLSASVIASYFLWFVLTLSVMVPFFWFSEPEQPRAIKAGGNITASINFCEGPDFHHSDVLAEPVNVATSMLFYMPVGLIGLLGPAWKEGRCELRFFLCYGGVALVGIGSGALHASLDAVAQAGDELPMLYASAMLAYCCADFFLTKRGWGRAAAWLPWITAFITAGNTVLYVASRDDFGIFAATFAAYVSVPVLYFSCYCL
ncbi:Alkaline ceramidase 3 (AlkCDase 3) (Alkaline CDase 3) (Alkaline phytoceramidase) (aPHC) [Durusdinium trenchii]